MPLALEAGKLLAIHKGAADFAGTVGAEIGTDHAVPIGHRSHRLA